MTVLPVNGFKILGIIRNHGINSARLYQTVYEDLMKIENVCVPSNAMIKEAYIVKIKSFTANLKRFYNEHQRHYDRLISAKHGWLDKVVLSLEVSAAFSPQASQGSVRGRPSVSYETASVRTKRRKVNELKDKADDEKQLIHAAIRSVRGCSDSSKKDLSAILKESLQSPGRPTKMKNRMESAPVYRNFTNEEALAYIIHSNISMQAYEDHRDECIDHCLPNFLPSKKRILTEKKMCYPNDIKITETSAECSLQSLMNHTAMRLVQATVSHWGMFIEENFASLTLFCKWGFDGSSSQKIYKQPYLHSNLQEACKEEETLFSTCMVPLMLKNDDQIIWINEVPSSTLLCRPIRLQYVKETPKVCENEEKHINNQLRNIKVFEFSHEINGREIRFKINYDLSLTMLDGKAINALTGTSSMCCNICGAKPSEMNKLALIESKNVEEKNLKYGTSILHCWIRFFEMILHLAYKLPVRKWRVTDKKEKEIVEKRKQDIIQNMRKDLSLIVDQPRVGFGNTNDGNTARKAFRHYKHFSKITDVDEEFIYSLYTILQVISSYREVDEHKFELYCSTARNRYLELYSWYNMTPTLHKVLFHGKLLIKSQLLPIGYYSEEAQESLNKVVRNARRDHTFKATRIKTMTDQMHYLLIRSDPVIGSINALKVRKHRIRKLELTSTATSLLKTLHIDNVDIENQLDIDCDQENTDKSDDEEEFLF